MYVSSAVGIFDGHIVMLLLPVCVASMQIAKFSRRDGKKKYAFKVRETFAPNGVLGRG